MDRSQLIAEIVENLNLVDPLTNMLCGGLGIDADNPKDDGEKIAIKLMKGVVVDNFTGGLDTYIEEDAALAEAHAYHTSETCKKMDIAMEKLAGDSNPGELTNRAMNNPEFPEEIKSRIMLRAMSRMVKSLGIDPEKLGAVMPDGVPSLGSEPGDMLKTIAEGAGGIVSEDPSDGKKHALCSGCGKCEEHHDSDGDPAVDTSEGVAEGEQKGPDGNLLN